jgi:hypothetical protein
MDRDRKTTDITDTTDDSENRAEPISTLRKRWPLGATSSQPMQGTSGGHAAVEGTSSNMAPVGFWGLDIVRARNMRADGPGLASMPVGARGGGGEGRGRGARRPWKKTGGQCFLESSHEPASKAVENEALSRPAYRALTDRGAMADK